MTGERVGRRAVVVASALALGLLLPTLITPQARADIYLRRDRFGVLHFTNVPTDKRYKLVMREPRVQARARSLAILPVAIRASAMRADSRAFDPIIAAVARRYDIEQALVKAVIKAESNFQPNAISPKGARGLMQLMPGTARRHGVRNIHEPIENITGGVQHLRMLLDRYAGDVRLALAAYNAGEGWVDQHGGVPPFAETRTYVQRVLQFRQHYLLHPTIAAVR